MTANDREERKRLEKKEKKEREEEEERNRLLNFVKYTLGLKHQVSEQLISILYYFITNYRYTLC